MDTQHIYAVLNKSIKLDHRHTNNTKPSSFRSFVSNTASICIYLCSQCLRSTFKTPAVLFSGYRKDVFFFLIQICKSLQRVCTTGGRLSVWFSSLKNYDKIFFECFVALVSSGPFRTLFFWLISCQLVTYLIYLKGKLVSQARPFLFLQQRQSHIGYEY